ncbi:MAG: MerR family transcriptional regulator [Sphingomonadaceae bacterium]
MTTPHSATTRTKWLTLEQASERLGVHPTTLRRWADDGAVDAFLTPGGHRRFRLADLERFEQEHHLSRCPIAPRGRLLDHAIAHTRHDIPSQRWVAAYGEAERETQRRLGRRLIGLTLQYLSRNDEGKELLAEARNIGAMHASYALQRGRPLSDLLQAISFFRTTLLEVALLEHPQPTQAQRENGVRMLRRIETLLGEVQAGVVELYQRGEIG